MKLNTRKLKDRGRETAGSLGLLPALRRRRFEACCCSLSKCGTHSIANVFSRYMSRHHPDRAFRIELAIDYHSGRIAEKRVAEILRRRDRKLWYEMESSSLTGALVEPLLQARPECKFILTIRDVYSWVDSWVDHYVNSPPPPGNRFVALNRVRLRPDEFPSTKHDALLLERGVTSLASLMQLWTAHNATVIATVASERLMIVKTDEIALRAQEMASWLGVQPDTLQLQYARSCSAPRKHRVLSTLDRGFVEDTMVKYCGDLMAAHFPDATISSNGT